MKKRTAIKTDLFAFDAHRKKIDTLGDPLAQIESHIDFAALAEEVDRVAPRPVGSQGGRPPYPTETMVRILVLKRLYKEIRDRPRFSARYSQLIHAESSSHAPPRPAHAAQHPNIFLRAVG